MSKESARAGPGLMLRAANHSAFYSVKIIGDDRPVIPLQRNLKVQVRDGADWKTLGELRDATARTVTVDFSQVVDAEGLRVFVPTTDLPKSDRADVDGIVRICELVLILTDGQESAVIPLPQP